MVSIKDIAKKCEVSTATVSKALNDCSDISESTKKRIREAAQELGYFPNSQARSLKINRTFSIGIIFEDRLGSGLRHSFFSSVLDSFKTEAEKRGYDIIFIGSDKTGKKMSYYEHCKYRNVDGVLLACADFYDSDVRKLKQKDNGLPVVSLDFFSKDDYSVYSDNRQGMRDIIEYVYDMGHRKIGYVYGDTSQVTTVRLDSFRETMKQLGLPVEIDYVCQGKYNDIETTGKIVKDMLSLYEPPTCIILPDDIAAYGAYRAVKDMDLKIPDDVSIVGFDGNELSQLVEPKLTTVFQNTKMLGINAADLLLKLINRESIPEMQRQIVVETKLLKGQTVKDLTK